MTNPIRLTPLSDPENVLFEEVAERPGFTEAEAYAFLVGADANTFGVPPITVADFDPNQLRDAQGMWSKVGGIDNFPELSHNDALAMQDVMLKFNENQKKLVNNYTGLGFKVNTALRNVKFMKPLSRNDSEYVAALKNIMSPTTRNLRVFRSTKQDNFGVKTLDELRGLVGKKFVDRGFVSTSIDSQMYMRFTNVTVFIDVPKGTRAVYAADVSNSPHERELILDAGTKFKIDKVEINGSQGRVWLSVVN